MNVRKGLLIGFFTLIFLVISGFAFSNSNFAQTPTPCLNPNAPCGQVPRTPTVTRAPAAADPDDPCTQQQTAEEEIESTESLEGVQFLTDPAPECIDEEKVQNVKITFRGLSENSSDYQLCTGTKDCLKEEGFVVGLTGPDSDVFKELPGSADGNGEVTVTVCGDGSSKVKFICPENSNENYFWGGRIYYLSIGRITDKQYYQPVSRGGFYVARSYPKVTVTPKTNLVVNNSITVTVSRDKLLFGSDPGRRNNFQIVVEGGEDNYFQDQCVTLRGDGDSQSRTFSGENGRGLLRGKYVIKISDQDNEGITHTDRCQGGFTYYKITCTVTNSNANPKGSCTEPEEGKDPNGEEYKAFLKELAALRKAGLAFNFPCGDGTKKSSVTDPGNCKTIKTAIGEISISPQGFIQSIFKIVLFFATFGGIIIIIYAGYVLMISRGDKEKVQGARETITAAIVGLLFIVLSIVILELIGVQILRLPGFTP